MRKIFGREKKVEKHSKEHVELVYKCLNKLKELMNHFYKNEFDLIDEKVKEISEIEHEADELRRMMEIEFYEGAFLPFDREDRIMLAEVVDSVADMIEAAAYGISLSKIRFPEEFEEEFSELMDTISDSVYVLKECIEMLDVDLSAAITKAHEVEEKEEKVDSIERRILKKLYESYRNEKIGVLKLIELKETVKKLGCIADRAENASDQALIIVAKRRG